MGITADRREVQIEFFSGQRATGPVFAQYDTFDLIEMFGKLIAVPHSEFVGRPRLLPRGRGSRKL